jgi:hypothetical protein
MSLRVRAALIHVGITSLVAALTALLVFSAWYPPPFARISGGQELFLILISLDVVLGPALTLVVIHERKPRAERVRDLALIACIQIAALAYGVWTMAQARPVYLVHELDRFQVVTVVDIEPQELSTAMPPFQRLPLWGYQILGVREPRNDDEKLASIALALAGRDVAKRPDWWMPWGETHRAALLERGKPLSSARGHTHTTDADLRKMLQKAAVPEDDVRLFPVVARDSTWSVLVDVRRLQVLGFVPIDGFVLP